MIKVAFLGTSYAIPTSDRNHTALLLTYNGENILVDCGEGTQRQFRKAKLNPCKVTRILITHWHGSCPWTPWSNTNTFIKWIQ